ncbi:hypothetical protein B484DRAFT_426185, partial [Ochromonadaceae sp. CCMP2298]
AAGGRLYKYAAEACAGVCDAAGLFAGGRGGSGRPQHAAAVSAAASALCLGRWLCCGAGWGALWGVHSRLLRGHCQGGLGG